MHWSSKGKSEDAESSNEGSKSDHDCKRLEYEESDGSEGVQERVCHRQEKVNESDSGGSCLTQRRIEKKRAQAVKAECRGQWYLLY